MHSDLQWEAWADALAEHEYVVIDGYLPDDLLHLLERFFQQHQDALQQAKVGAWADRQEALKVRSDLTYWLDRQRDNALDPLFAWIETSLQRWNRLLYLSLSGYEFHLAYYPNGGHYSKHLDQFRGRNNRLISCVLYLNADWKPGDGGELQLYDPRGETPTERIQPLRNRMVFFRSDTVWHEVLPAHAPRKSLTGWLLYQPSGVGAVIGA